MGSTPINQKGESDYFIYILFYTRKNIRSYLIKYITQCILRSVIYLIFKVRHTTTKSDNYLFLLNENRIPIRNVYCVFYVFTDIVELAYTKCFLLQKVKANIVTQNTLHREDLILRAHWVMCNVCLESTLQFAKVSSALDNYMPENKASRLIC